MSLSLFTVIQAEDSLLARAVEGLEQMTRSTHPNVMRATEPRQQRQPIADEDQHVYLKDDAPPSSATSLPPLPRQQNLPTRLARPDTPRRSTAPEFQPQRPGSSPYQTSTEALYAHTLVHPPRPRNRSPYSRNNLRSRSANTSAMSQPMTRAQSLPARTTSPNSLSPAIGSSSPLLRPSPRSTSPFRPSSPHESQMYSAPSPSFYDAGFETISEHAELDLSRSSFDRNIGTLNSSRPVSSRRPRQVSPSRSPLSSSASSPSLSAQKFNENFPTLHHSGSTSSFASLPSMPSTPSSNRSRSPSISSLETIEDAPDAEWEAIEADRLAKLKAAADAEDGEHVPRRSSLDIPSRPVGFGFTRSTARKRWSVCGAERRADLDLETIWED
ncbi:hypothetical protein K461DRAFT_277005 [Myriangium duriaei CBS 260.36]|uniref:Basic proline-rich protein n=1 Tax=Myriangium duriaei CBS 260.36 TaxID=1168546 RepID=A0A9P4J676_9PEZI|nr:hypothetical protein K461DRAFT_277005 [Myriangium duriaei CBS 260.36]